MTSVASGDPGRTRKTARNALVGLTTQFVTLGLSFISRTIFIAVLGAELVGVSSVFAGMLSVLSVAELGFTGAFAYALYAPLQAQDWSKVGGLLRLYRRIFRQIALTVAGAGVAAILLLPVVIDAAIALTELVLYYCLFLANSVLSYLFADRVAVITADQRLYLVRAVTFVVDLGRIALQIAVLLVWHSYAGYLLVQLCGSMLVNIILSSHANRLYPDAFQDAEDLDNDEKTRIMHNVKGTAVYKVSGVLLHGSTTVLISVLLGTLLLGYYANYAMVVGAIIMSIDVAFSAGTASVGHLAVSKDRSRALMVFEEATMLTFILHTVAGVVLLVALDDVVGLWLGQNFRLGPAVVVAIVLNFYGYGMVRPTALFREAAGLFTRARYVLVATAISNVVMAVVLGLWIGLPGILVANPIARLVTQAWMEPAILLRSFFGAPVRPFLLQQSAFFGLAVLAALSAVGVAEAFKQDWASGPLAKSLIGFVISSLVVSICLARTAAVRRLLSRFRSLTGHA